MKLSIVAVIIASVVWLPNYFISNEGSGTFWTYPLALSTAFIPIALFGINRFVFFITLIIAIFVATILKSKASFVYIILPIIFYYIFFYINIYKIFLEKKYFKSLLISFFIVILISISLFANYFGSSISRGCTVLTVECTPNARCAICILSSGLNNSRRTR